MGISAQFEPLRNTAVYKSTCRQLYEYCATGPYATVLTTTLFSPDRQALANPTERDTVYALICQTLTDHGAFVQDVHQHELHAIFQSPHQTHAAQAVLAGLDTLQQITLLRHLQPEWGAASLRLSIGIHTPEVHLNGSRASGAAVGWEQAFSITRRLSELNRQTPFPAVFVTGHTHRWLQHNRSWHIEHLGESTLDETGFKHPLYAVICPFQ